MPAELIGYVLLIVGVVAVFVQSFDVCKPNVPDHYKIGCVICAMLNGAMIVTGAAFIFKLVVLPNG